MAIIEPIRPEAVYSAEDLIPQIESRIFYDRPEAHYWVGKVATGNVIDMPAEYIGHHQLRANVFIDQEHFLPETSRNGDGGEYDEYDDRAVQFAILENINSHPGVVGTVRLIEKRTEDEKLPAELLFPEVFDEHPAETGAVEVSRLIARHPVPASQELISLAAIRTSDFYCVDKNVPNTYSVVEQHLYRRLRMMGIPCHPMTEEKVLPDFGNTKNMVIRINPQEMLDKALAAKGRREVLRKFFETQLDSLGLGYYDSMLAQEQ
jgi:N-acyl-L-homoserine lactone synthetase